jgi:hypothetical protein
MATIKYEENRQEQTRLAPTIQKSIDETIPEKYSTIASGATTIGSAERAPDDIFWQALEHVKWRSVTPIGSEFYGCLNLDIFSQNLTVT